jgi:hypothetical protein
MPYCCRICVVLCGKKGIEKVMGTRAVYTFIDDSGTHHVYKHWEGYPADALEAIASAKSRAWSLPRFEADEFAASFVAVNKTKEGDVRLTTHYDRHGDLEWRYEVRHRPNDKDLYIKIYEITYGNPNHLLMGQGYLCDLLEKWTERYQTMIDNLSRREKLRLRLV